MNMFDSSFLCLDIGTSCVRGIAHRVRSGRIDRSATFAVDNTDTVFALKSVIDELEQKIGAHFDNAYITGNFGPSAFSMVAKNTIWNTEHKITASDVRNQLSQIASPDGYFPMHIIPLRYDTSGAHNMASPIGTTDKQLISAFGTIFYSHDALETVMSYLRRAHIQPIAFYDPSMIQSAAFRTPHKSTLFIDFGAEFTSASIWTDRGPVWHTKIAHGGRDITNAISSELGIDFVGAERIKRNVANLIPQEMDRFTPADTAYEFSRADINDIVLPAYVDIIAAAKGAATTAMGKYRPCQILISGGGGEINGINDFVENAFALPVENMHADASVRALSQYIWDCESAHRDAYTARANRWNARLERILKIFKYKRKKPRTRFIPIMPSTLCFDMTSPSTYSMFQSGGISAIHVDIMDGFYVDRVAGGISQLKYIREHTDAHLHVHLMTESPSVWAADAVSAGADTVILSTNTSGLRAAIRIVHAAGKRVGIALNPDSPVALLKPVLREIDEVMIMTVAPGAAGQEFQSSCLNKISILAATRQKYNLKYKISVDGGINRDTAALCWNAGADLLVSGSYLSRSHDFPLAVQSLLKKQSE